MKNLYLFHYRQIQKAVNGFNQKFFFVIAREDLEGVANLAFCQAHHKYNPNKAAFSTYLHHNLYGRLKAYIKKELKQQTVELNEELCYQKSTNIMEKEISKEAREVVRVVYNSPDILLNLHPKKKITKKTLRYYFSKIRGWEFKVIESSFKEIREALI